MGLVSHLAGAAHAQETAGKGRLSLDGTLFDYRTVAAKVTIEDPVTGAEVEAEESLSTTSGGLLGGGFGVGFGYGTGRSTVLGTRVLLASTRLEYDDLGESTQNTLALVPYFEYVAAPGRPVRPAVSLEIGVERSEAKADGESVSATTAGLFGVGAGLHAFVAPGFSLDPTVAIYGVSSRTELGEGVEASGSGVAIIGRVSFSGWPGKGRPVEAKDGGQKRPASESRAVAAAGDEPEAPSEAQSPLDRGRIEESIVLTRQASLTVRATPLSAPDSASLSLVLRGDAAALECDAVSVRAGAAAHELRDVTVERRGGGFSAIKVLTGTIDRESFAAIALSREPVVVVACGEEWEVSESQLAKLHRVDVTIRRVLDGSRLAPRLPSVSDDRGTLDATVAMTPLASLRFKGQPTRSGDEVDVSLIWRSDQPKFASCSELSIESSDESFEAEGVERESVRRGSRIVEALGGSIDVRAAVAVAEARKPVRVVACGESLEVPPGAQEGTWQFVQVFARQAIKAGTWAQAPVEPQADDADDGAGK